MTSRPGLLLLVLVGAGCATSVDVEPPPHDPQLAVHALFTPDSLWAVRVTRTEPFTSAAAPAHVDDATVEVWEGGRLVATPTLRDSGLYVAAGEGARPDRSYTLRVRAPGLEDIEGQGALPTPPAVTAWHETAVPGDAASPRRRRAQVSLTLDDPPGVANYYGLFVVQLRWREDRRTGQWTPLPPSLFPFSSDDLALGEGDIAFLGLDEALYRDAFFTDGLFDGEAYPLHFDVQYDAPRPEDVVVIHRAFVVVMLSASKDLYRYWTTANQQAFTNENPFAEPLQVYTNLSGGVGVFAGFRYRLFVLRLGSVSDVPSRLCTLIQRQLPVCTSLPMP